ncbi:hypothetical protein BN1184_BO_00840 [Pantoea ananatis]|nr:hypothetical protein BN1184_BO_00840 [Pantoea ananatis]
MLIQFTASLIKKNGVDFLMNRSINRGGKSGCHKADMIGILVKFLV